MNFWAKPKGPDSPFWKGGVITEPRGYRKVMLPDHPRANSCGYVYEHIVVMERKIGRPLAEAECVHHIDGDRSNNHPDNLRLCASLKEHNSCHRRRDLERRADGEDNPLVPCACGCGQLRRKYDTVGIRRPYCNGHNGRCVKGKKWQAKYAPTPGTAR